MMAFIGVRISWLMLARNIDFACVASSAASFATRRASAAARSSVTSSKIQTEPWSRSGGAMARPVRRHQNSVPSLRLTSAARQLLAGEGAHALVLFVGPRVPDAARPALELARPVSEDLLELAVAAGDHGLAHER